MQDWLQKLAAVLAAILILVLLLASRQSTAPPSDEVREPALPTASIQMPVVLTDWCSGSMPEPGAASPVVEIPRFASAERVHLQRPAYGQELRFLTRAGHADVLAFYEKHFAEVGMIVKGLGMRYTSVSRLVFHCGAPAGQAAAAEAGPEAEVLLRERSDGRQTVAVRVVYRGTISETLTPEEWTLRSP